MIPLLGDMFQLLLFTSFGLERVLTVYVTEALEMMSRFCSLRKSQLSGWNCSVRRLEEDAVDLWSSGTSCAFFRGSFGLDEAARRCFPNDNIGVEVAVHLGDRAVRNMTFGM